MQTSLNKSVEDMKTQEKKLAERKAAINSNITTHKRAISDLSKKINALEQELNDLESFQPSQQPDIAELEENMEVFSLELFCSFSSYLYGVLH
jgi:chromosome segregation ATPase